MTDDFEDRRDISLAKHLVRLNRGKTYASHIQFLVILALFVRTVDTQSLLGISSITATMLAFILGAFGVWLLGYLDDRLGMFSSFINYRQKLSPKWKGIYKRLDNIEKKIEEEN